MLHFLLIFVVVDDDGNVFVGTVRGGSAAFFGTDNNNKYGMSSLSCALELNMACLLVTVCYFFPGYWKLKR